MSDEDEDEGKPKPADSIKEVTSKLGKIQDKHKKDTAKRFTKGGGKKK